jgi:hypothetical protein
MKVENNRRHFFKQLLGTSAALGVLSAAPSQAQKTATKTEEKTSKGYHETDHVRDYYQKINF